VKDISAGYDRRMMFVDASDIDSEYTTAPTGTDRTNILAAMKIRGQAELAAQNEVALVKTEPTKNSTIYKYREHYAVGDIITVDGEYNETSSMQISEYVEIEDETGESGYPTLSAI
jgi:sulfate adenylyltransferase subunit 1 (EFTu-like GTPase family)